ncbi:MAG: AtpZ/AtpI family protein [Cyclobacteriaceae bacterium]|nr:AtpZ/AtpI family protein [Cyclobacteriaceae bacterium]
MALEHPEASDPKKQSPSNTYLKYSGLAIQLLVSIGVFGWIGYKLDKYLGIQFPVFLLIFGFSAFVGMMYLLYRSINKP